MSRQLFGRKVHLLTFTYDNAHVPIYRRCTSVDSLTGEVLKVVTGFADFERERFLTCAPFTRHRNKKGVMVKRYSPYMYERLTGYKAVVEQRELYQSLRYDDIKKLLKRFRHSFELSDYICVPEYGGAGYRPHYHFIAIGLSDDAVSFLVSNWKMGSVDVRSVPSSDISQLSKVSNYLAKYASKGCYDCPYIFSGHCLAPRRSISENFGVGDAESFAALKYRLCRFDLYGEYDPITVNSDTINVNALLRERKYSINGFSYPLPKYLIRKIFFSKKSYYDYREEVTKTHVVASPLQRKVANAVLSDLVKDFEKKYPESFTPDRKAFCSTSTVQSYDPFKDYSDAVTADFKRSIEQDTIY